MILPELLSLVFRVLCFVFLLVKTLITPYFEKFDIVLANEIYSTLDNPPEFISIIANSSINDGKDIYLGEARVSILFDLGLYLD